MIIRKGTYFVRFMDSDETRAGLTLAEAQRAAEEFCGNSSYSRIPGENSFLYGPGDGTVSVMVREEIEFVSTGGRANV